jgi:hypothetical protein
LGLSFGGPDDEDTLGKIEHISLELKVGIEKE